MEKVQEIIKAKDEQVALIDQYEKMMTIKNDENMVLKAQLKKYEEMLERAENLHAQELEKKIEIEKKLESEKELQKKHAEDLVERVNEKRVKDLVVHWETVEIEKKSEMEKKLEIEELEKKGKMEEATRRPDVFFEERVVEERVDGQQARGSNDPEPMPAMPTRPPPPPPPPRNPTPGVPAKVEVEVFNIGTPILLGSPRQRPREVEVANVEAPWLGLGGGSAGLEVPEYKVSQDFFTHLMEQMQEYLGGDVHQTAGDIGANYFEGHLDQYRVMNKKNVYVTLTVVLMLKDAGKTTTNSATYRAFQAKILMRGLASTMMMDQRFKDMMKLLAEFLWAGNDRR